MLERLSFALIPVLLVACTKACGNTEDGAGLQNRNPTDTAGLLFHADWSTEVGTSRAAFTDGGAWDGFQGNNANAQIASAASLGLADWPTANAYHTGIEGGGGHIRAHQVWINGLGEVRPGSHRYFRYYLQVRYGDHHGAASNHSFEHGVENLVNATPGDDVEGGTFYRVPRNDGTFFVGYYDFINPMRWVASGLRLNKNQTYRLEWHLSFATTTYTVEIRIYDAAGTLVADESHFRALAGAQLPLDQQAIPWNPDRDSRRFAGWRIGTNGPTSNFPMQNMAAADQLFVHGAVCVRADRWCGPYSGDV